MYRGNAALAISQIGKLDKLLSDLIQLPRKVAAAVAPKITRRLETEFLDGADPYGRPWAPLRQSTLDSGRSPPPLTHRGTLKLGTRARPASGNRAGLLLVLGASYGYFHQVGFRVGRTRVPARRILPQFGMPPEWRKDLNATASSIARKLAQGGH